MYAKIQNNGVCPVDRFFVLGLTTSRSNDEKIGQFGSGAKHAMFTLLRAGLDVVIYSGHSRITFLTKDEISGGHEYKKVFAVVDGVEHPLNIALSFGELDWKNAVDMAMRELIANAIDASDSIEDVLVAITTGNPEPCDGKTTVYVEANQDVKNYVGDLEHRFLQFDGKDYKTGQIIDKDVSDKVRFYHKGVFVKFGQTNSLFDYNFGDDMAIDESRNMEAHNCSSIVAKYLSKDPQRLRKIFRVLNKSDKYYETELYSFTLEHQAAFNSEIWQKAWEMEYGPKALVVHIDNGHLVEKAMENGYRCILVANNSWYGALIKAGIKTPISVIDELDENGNEILLPSPLISHNVQVVWEWFEELNMTLDKNKPSVVMFKSNTGKPIMGFVKDDCIYINEEAQSSVQTVFEELSHYISGHMDETRAFQNFLIEYAVRRSNDS